MPASDHCKRVNVLGVGLSVINRQTALQLALDALGRGARGYISVTGVHGVIEAQDDAVFRDILNSSFLCTPDGMPMVWMGRLAGHREMDRVYGPDFMLDVCAASVERGIRHFLYGGAPGVAATLKQRLEARFPGLQVVGTYEPPFRPLNQAEAEELRHQVEAARPDVLWVGLSTPKQERFMAEYLPRLQVTLMAGVGAAFDFHTGRIRQAPHWMQRCGLEWFFRLCQEPRRLWRRYLKNNPRFVALALGQLLRIKKYDLPRT
jgi:N-acetylglucosaminyldiphosphoundecaprenol N-acetyl-beta-D-mannosaminyltransferase